MRRMIFWLHLSAGICAGTVVLIMSVTGVLLTYQKQMIAWADREFQVSPAAETKRLPIDVLLSNMQTGGIPIPAGLTVYSDPAAPVAVTGAAGNAASTYVNPYTGAILGQGSQGIRTFFRYVTDWHRYLSMSGDSRSLGRTITGACNLTFLFIVCSGFYIWWPRKRTMEALKTATWFRKGRAGKARDWNWHNVFGVWSAIPLFFVVLSGVVMSYTWANNLVYSITRTEPPAPAGARDGGNRPGDAIDLRGIDALLAQAKQQNPEWKSIAVRLPRSTDASVVFNIDGGNGGQPQLRSTLTLDRKTGSIVRTETFANQNRGRRLRSWFRFAHTGEFYGVLGQTIAGLASFGAAMLVGTGFALSWRRLCAFLRRGARMSRELRELQSAAQNPE